MMRALLDSHILLWALTGDERLPQGARDIILDADNTIYYSAASVWELAIKHALHPESITISAAELMDLCGKAGFVQLHVKGDHAATIDSLTRDPSAKPHKDPFDRMLIAQAKYEGMAFVTHDSLLPAYNEPCIEFV